ncbi:MAG: glycosyltransferase [Candidatus Omnitrophota bacterium]|jgi:glycosyltransferase involved in cell wall biosynthesis|nr:MAG: glycosyltransferase [Candidatus Omnitrophota bacterium]
MNNQNTTVLGISLDYLMLLNDNVRGDVKMRQLEYAKLLSSFSIIVYSPRALKLKPQKWAENLYIYPTNSRNKATFIMDAYRIASELCKEKKFDVITTEDPFTTASVGYLLKRKYHLPLNMQVHCNFCNNRFWINNRLINRFFDIIAKFLLKKADTIRVGTSLDKQNIAKIGIDEKRIHIIPVHMDLDKFIHGNGEKIRRELLASVFNNIVMFVGRLSKEKDLPTLLKAFRLTLNKRNDILLILIGKGKEEQKLKKLADRLNLGNNVKFLGSISHDLLPDYLSAADVFVISSLFEGTCIAMAEALAAGKPVISTRVAGAIDLIEEGKNGFIVDQRDYSGLAEGIIYVLNNNKLFADNKRQNFEVLKNKFNRKANIENLIGLWEKTSEIAPENELKIITNYPVTPCPVWEKNVVIIYNNFNKKPIHNQLFARLYKITKEALLLGRLILSSGKYDILITYKDRVSYLFSILQGIFGKRIYHVMLNCLWALPKSPLRQRIRKKMTGMSLTGLDKTVVFARHEIFDYKRVFDFSKDNFIHIPYYFTSTSYQAIPEDGNYIFSGGHAHYRDYETLIEAVTGMDIECKIATQIPEYFESIKIPKNVHISCLSAKEYFECMAKSKIVVVPLKKGYFRSTGQRTYLNAMLLGKPLIVCDEYGAYDYVTNNEEGIIIPPGDPTRLRNEIKKFLNGDYDIQEMARKARLKAKGFSVDNTMGQIIKLAEQITGKRIKSSEIR